MMLKSKLTDAFGILIYVILRGYLYRLQDYTHHKYSNTGFAKKAISILGYFCKS